MAIERTALGTASDKSAALSLTLSNVTIQERTTLIVMISYDIGDGAPTVAWGNHTVDQITGAGGSGNGIATRVYSYLRRKKTATNNLVATWATSAPTAKVLVATQWSDADIVDQVSTSSQAGTGSPTSGTAVTALVADEAFIGALGSEGPSGDTVGTPINSYTSGQRISTSGSPPVSNITLHEVYKIISATENTQAGVTGATSRDWTCGLVTLRQSRFHQIGFSPSDFLFWVDAFHAENPELAIRNLAFHYSQKLDRLEVYDIDLSTGTLKGYLEPQTDWVIL